MEELFEVSKLALTALKANKLRSGLTMLGVIIGVTSVILLVSIGSGLQKYIEKQFEILGSNIIIVMPGGYDLESGGLGGVHGPPNIQGSKLTLSHVRDLEKLGEPVVASTPVFELSTKVTYQNNSKQTTLMAVTEQYSLVRNLNIQKGRLLSRSDLDSARKVCVIGPSLAEYFYGDSDPIGREMTISERRFSVIGVAEKLGSMVGFDLDNMVYIPITTAQKVIGFENLMEILVKVSENSKIDTAKSLVKSYFLRQMTADDFSVLDQRQILNIINQILAVLTATLGGIAAISLIVGGIGIMNIMLVSVSERTREIGLRKAVGATPRALLGQFLIEAIILSFGGGLIGIILGGSLSLALNQFIPASVTLWSILLAFGVSALVGVIFGVAPALRAAKLNPIEALRYE